MKQNYPNPWLGLRSYQEGETLFGRSDEIISLTQCILSNIQTVLYGRSGIGKTSILNAGVFPAARKKGVFPVNIRLAHNGDSYFSQISGAVFHALKNLRKDSLDDNGDRVSVFESGTYKERTKALGNGVESLWEFLHRHEFYDASGNRIKPLLVFDQFEEIFTIEKDKSKVRCFFDELADLLNGVVPEYISVATDDYSAGKTSKSTDDGLAFDLADFNVTDEQYEDYLTTSDFHIVFTLREDFLSYLERETFRIPSLRQNRYCLQSINEEQASIIIMNPLPGLVSRDVAKMIIAKIVGEHDFDLDGISEKSVDSAILSLYMSRIYEKMLGNNEDIISEGLVRLLGDNIIDDFYHESIQSVSESTVEYLEDHLINYDGRRESVSLTNIINVGQIPQSDIDILQDMHLVRVFSYENDIRIEYVHDILCSTIVDRRNNRSIIKEQEEINRQLIENAERLKRKSRRLLLTIGIILFAIVLSGLIVYCGYFIPVSHIYADTVNKYGWVYGIERLTKKEAQYRTYHVVLKKKGLFAKHYTYEEIRDGYGNLTSDFSWTPYTFNRFDNPDSLRIPESVVELFRRTCQFETIADEDGNVIQERGLDKDGNILFNLNERWVSESVFISSYTDAYGFPIRFRDSTYFFIRETLDEKGRSCFVEYFNDEGEPVTGSDGEFAFARMYNEDDLVCDVGDTDMDSNPVNNSDGYSSYTKKYDGFNVVERRFYDHADYSTMDEDSVWVEKYEYDQHSRLSKLSFWTLEDTKAENKYGCHAILYKYNTHGKTVEQEWIDTLGNHIPGTEDDYYLYRASYDDLGNAVSKEFYYPGKIMCNSRRFVDNEVKYDADYYVIGTDTTYTYKYSKDDNIEVTEYDGVVETNVYDSRGRILSRSITNSLGEPMDTADEYATVTYTYEDMPAKTTRRSIIRGANGDIIGSRRVYIDSVKQKGVTLSFDSEGRYTNGWASFFDEFDDHQTIVMTMSLNYDSDFRDSVYNDNSYSEYLFHYIYSAKPTEVKSKIGSSNIMDETDTANKTAIGRLYVNEFGRPTYSMVTTEDYNEKFACLELFDKTTGQVRYYDEDMKLSADKEPAHYVNTLYFYENQDDFYTRGLRGGDIIMYYDEKIFIVYRFDFVAGDYRAHLVKVDEPLPRGIAESLRYITEAEGIHIVHSSLDMVTVDATKDEEGQAYQSGMRYGYLLGINEWNSSGNYYIDEKESDEILDKYIDSNKTVKIYNPETQSIEEYKFGPGKLGIELDSSYVDPELRYNLIIKNSKYE